MLLLRSRCSTVARKSPMSSPVCMDEAYPDIRKDYYVPPQAIPISESHIRSCPRAPEILKNGAYTIPEDYVVTLRNASCCTTNNVVVPSAGRILIESMNGATTFSKVLGPIPAEAFDGVKSVDGYATLLDSNFSGYYHQLLELVPRLLALNRPPYTEVGEIKLLTSRGIHPIAALVLSRLRGLKLQPVHLAPGGLLRVEQLLFTPFKTRQFAGFLPPRYADELRSILLPTRAPTRRHRIFISRERSRKRRIRNQDALLRMLARLGFEKYVLEDMTPEAQIELFYDADVVVGTHGAGLTNVLFSPHVRVLELFPHKAIVPHYLFLCKSLGHPYRFWSNSASSRWDLEYMRLRLRQHIDSKPQLGDDASSQRHGRAINMSYTVDVHAVSAILGEMGVR